MTRERRARVADAVLLALVGAACGSKTVATPTPPEPAVEAVVPAPARSVASVVETQTTGPLTEGPPVPAEAAVVGPEPLAGEAGRLPRAAGTESLGEENVVEDGAAETSEAPRATAPRRVIPRLGPVLTREQRRERNRLIDRDLDAARRIVASIVGRDLTAEQINTVRRVREFLRQAEEARSRDPALARNLAGRAVVLARDLARSLK